MAEKGLSVVQSCLHKQMAVFSFSVVSTLNSILLHLIVCCCGGFCYDLGVPGTVLVF